MLGKNRELRKIVGIFAANIPSVIGNKGGGLNFLLTPHELSDDPLLSVSICVIRGE